MKVTYIPSKGGQWIDFLRNLNRIQTKLKGLHPEAWEHMSMELSYAGEFNYSLAVTRQLRMYKEAFADLTHEEVDILVRWNAGLIRLLPSHP